MWILAPMGGLGTNPLCMAERQLFFRKSSSFGMNLQRKRLEAEEAVSLYSFDNAGSLLIAQLCK